MVTIYIILFGCVFNLCLIGCEKFSQRNPNHGFTIWWRKHIISDTHDED